MLSFTPFHSSSAESTFCSASTTETFIVTVVVLRLELLAGVGLTKVMSGGAV